MIVIILHTLATIPNIQNQNTKYLLQISMMMVVKCNKFLTHHNSKFGLRVKVCISRVLLILDVSFHLYSPAISGLLHAKSTHPCQINHYKFPTGSVKFKLHGKFQQMMLFEIRTTCVK